MQQYIRVDLEGMAPDPSVEAAALRWVARLEESGLPIGGAIVEIEHVGRRGTVVSVRVDITGGSTMTASAARDEIYVAVADAFRAVRRQLLAHAAGAGAGGGASNDGRIRIAAAAAGAR